jgi:hypothetical protein
MSKRGARYLLMGLLALGLSAPVPAQAAPLTVEINGREFYGSTFNEGNDVYVALDVVGPLLLGADFALEEYDIVLRRARFRYTPVGGQPTHLYLPGCLKRGTAIYGPLQALVKQVGGSSAVSHDTWSVAYPPASAVQAPAKPAVIVKPVPPTDDRIQGPEQALQLAHSANLHALRPSGRVRRVEIYHPLSPDPAEAIPSTDLAGLKLYLPGLTAKDRVRVALWDGREPGGSPVLVRALTGFTDDEQEQGAIFVRLPLRAASGWHVLRIMFNNTESVDYRFVTF